MSALRPRRLMNGIAHVHRTTSVDSCKLRPRTRKSKHWPPIKEIIAKLNRSTNVLFSAVCTHVMHLQGSMTQLDVRIEPFCMRRLRKTQANAYSECLHQSVMLIIDIGSSFVSAVSNAQMQLCTHKSFCKLHNWYVGTYDTGMWIC